MIHYDAAELTIKQHYKFLTGSVIPRPIAWITTLDQQTNTVNLAPFSYFSIVAKDLPLVSLSINSREGSMKDTARNLIQNKEGVIHIVSAELVEAMNQTSAELPPEKSELSLTDLTLTESRSVYVPAIQDALIRMEVRVHDYLPIKGHEDKIISDFFILEVLDYYFDPQIFDAEKEYILPEKLDPVSRLAGNTYAHIHELFDLRRPN